MAAAVAMALRLPRATGRRIVVRRDLSVRARDGVILRTDHYSPGHRAPAVLMRTPYGRDAVTGLIGRLLAERGLHVLVQFCRGTNGSGGRFEPLAHERADGLDTLDWLRRQPWYAGRLGLVGASYQGMATWALATEEIPELAAVVVAVSTAGIRDLIYAGESFSLDTVLTWAELMETQTVPWLPRRVELVRGQPRLAAGFGHLPLAAADRVATGRTVPFYQEWLTEHAAGADYWRGRDFGERLAGLTVPVAMVAAWQDIFLPGQLADFEALRRAGRRPSLTIGPWTHSAPGVFAAALRVGVPFMVKHLLDPAAVPDGRVDITLTGADGRRDRWPPRTRDTAFYLQPDRGLATVPAPAGPPDTFRYDPADPTPSLGGPLLVESRAGVKDNRELEARPDVLTYTSAPLDRDVTAIGTPSAEIWQSSSVPYHDVFVRICDVDPAGVSRNVCDGLTRVEGDGVHPVTVRMWPIGHVFRAGHRVRVQVSGGAHPRWARNPGTGEPLGAAVGMRAGERAVFHDGERRSAVHLPIEESDYDAFE
ncbi:CocE/NonD family hydrolase [Catenuloplanes indicus]|nr:CocE/NonD family hydrolase [Catenuloplanes indicus]